MQKITFQGAPGAYSHIACKELFPGADYIASDTFEQAMELVDNGEADFAVIPVENSNAGRVSDVHFLLPKTDLTIVGEHFLRVEHQLLALPGAKLEEIEAAASHPQALAQCSEFLKNTPLRPCRALTRRSRASVLSRCRTRRGRRLRPNWRRRFTGLTFWHQTLKTRRTIRRGFGDEQAQGDAGGRRSKFITSLVFHVKNIPAALYKALGGFATNGVNLIKLESYVVGGNFVSAQFYVEIEAHPESQAFKLAFDELKFYSEGIHFLGTYKANPRRYL